MDELVSGLLLEEEVISILTRVAQSIGKDSKVYIMETLWDRQRCWNSILLPDTNQPLTLQQWPTATVRCSIRWPDPLHWKCRIEVEEIQDNIGLGQYPAMQTEMSSKEIILSGRRAVPADSPTPAHGNDRPLLWDRKKYILVRADRHYRQPFCRDGITGNGNHRAHRPVGGGTCRLYLYAAERTCTIRFYRFGRKDENFIPSSAGAELYTGITIVQEVFDITLITVEVKENAWIAGRMPDENISEERMKRKQVHIRRYPTDRTTIKVRFSEIDSMQKARRICALFRRRTRSWKAIRSGLYEHLPGRICSSYRRPDLPVQTTVVFGEWSDCRDTVYPQWCRQNSFEYTIYRGAWTKNIVATGTTSHRHLEYK